jgi:hypothetical protein
MNIGQVAKLKVQEFVLGRRRRVLWELVNERSHIDQGDLEDLSKVGWIRWCSMSSDYQLTDIGREQLPKGGSQ